MYPTTSKPFYVRISNAGEAIPSLKNKKRPVISTRKDGSQYVAIAKSPDVVRFLQQASLLVDNAYVQQGFETIPKTIAVYVYCKFRSLASSLSDLDNQYTTIQELLQNPYSRVLENDRQVKGYAVELSTVTLKNAQSVDVFVWMSDDLGILNSALCMLTAQHQSQKQGMPAQTNVELPNLEKLLGL